MTIDFYLRLQVNVLISNGGYITISQLDQSPQENVTHYYTGLTKSVTSRFIFDRTKPIHCEVESTVTCQTSGNTLTSMLSVGNEVSDIPYVNVIWNGWMDPGGSGIRGYTLEVYEMEARGPTLTEAASPFVQEKFVSASHEYNVTFPQPGLYSFVLYVFDVAGNIRLTRCFVLFDNISSATVDARHHPINFPQSIPSVTSGRKWQTVANGHILTNWTGHFYNTLLQKKPLLSRIAAFRKKIDSAYDQPASRLSLNGTVNSQGIVGCQYAVTYDLNPNQPNMSDFRKILLSSSGLQLTESTTFKTRTDDGDHITIWLKATDIFGNYAIDNATVYIDSSAPSISNVWIERAGETGVTFLNTPNFHEMTVTFDVDDPHSGVVAASWRLGQTEGGRENGEDAITTRPPSRVIPFRFLTFSVVILVSLE